MLSEFEQAVIRNNGLNMDEVEGITTSYEVTLKDGSKHQLCEVYSRVMGYLRPMSEYNIGKRQEHSDRVLFNVEKCGCNN